jgi:Zn-dependent metalloprotease
MENVVNIGDVKDNAKVSKTDDAARQASQNLLSDTVDLAAGKSGPMQNIKPDGFSAIPPYLLNEIARRTGNGAFAAAARDAENMQSHGTVFRPRVPNVDGRGDREVYDAQKKEELPGVKARFEGEKPTGNEEVDRAYDFTGFVRDFYKQQHQRDSIDGQGMKYVSTVNYGENYENAFWNGSQMTYGKPGADSPFKTFMLLDVAGHEITHGVTEKEANETYYGQSGALNESNSDVFGELIKQYSKHQTADQADWLVGDGIWKDNIKGRALRDMLNPGTAYDDPAVGKDPQPAHMKDYYKTWGDNGGVHYNSGIPNRAFALFAKAVGGYAWEDPGHIWWTARKNAGNDPSFASFAFQTIEAAKALGKPGEVEKLQKAWEAVGVTPAAKARDIDTPSIDNTTLKKAG